MDIIEKYDQFYIIQQENIEIIFVKGRGGGVNRKNLVFWPAMGNFWLYKFTFGS